VADAPADADARDDSAAEHEDEQAGAQESGAELGKGDAAALSAPQGDMDSGDDKTVHKAEHVVSSASETPASPQEQVKHNHEPPEEAPRPLTAKEQEAVRMEALFQADLESLGQHSALDTNWKHPVEVDPDIANPMKRIEHAVSAQREVNRKLR